MIDKYINQEHAVKEIVKNDQSWKPNKPWEELQSHDWEDKINDPLKGSQQPATRKGKEPEKHKMRLLWTGKNGNYSSLQ